MSYQGATSVRIPTHEIGHCFNLYHDFKNYGDVIESEKVTRTFNVIGYNATTAGDRVFDTPATRVWDLSPDNYNENGFYIGGDMDYNILPDYHIDRYFKNYPPRLNNMMHVHEGQDLAMGYFFTSGQGNRIRWSLATDTVNGYGIWSLAETDRAELYLPFETQIVPGNEVISVTDNGDGTATVCHPRVQRDRFQKGLNYVFENPDITDPSEIAEFDHSTPNDLKEIDRTYDYNVKVLDLDSGNITRVYISCTKGLVCWFEEFVEGLVISTKVLGSMNLTVQQLNEIQVKDPNLYDSLMSDYYYILKKMTASGAINQKVFYKD